MSKSIPVSFKEIEEELYNYSKTKDFSYYVKNLIRKDMLSQENTQVIKRVEEKQKPRRNANFEI